MAPHSPQSAGGQSSAWGRGSGVGPLGPRTPGWEQQPSGEGPREAPAGTACQPLCAQAQSGHVALPAPAFAAAAAVGEPSAGLPSHLTAPGVPARKDRARPLLPRHRLSPSAGSGVCHRYGNPRSRERGKADRRTVRVSVAALEGWD